jgi:2-polyprenyl-3-methyl-5-hydroxy-6-metoxy-1,4-benzoquinol methylase
MVARNIHELRQHWDDLAKADAPWAIYSSQDKKFGRWRMEEFWATGRRDVMDMIKMLGDAGVTVAGGRALDFGCGMGRLTQPLAEHFNQVDGVDISAEMIRQARRYNHHGDRVAYHLNVTEDLGVFDAETFDLVYTLVVLQHMPVTLTFRYLEEFLRLLKPGGVAVFQVPLARTAHDTQGAQIRQLPRWHPRRIMNKLRALILSDPSTRFYRFRRLRVSERIIYRVFRTHPTMGMHTVDEVALRTHVLTHGGEIIHVRRDDGRAGRGVISATFVAQKS